MVKGKGVLELMAKKHEKKHQALELEPFTMFYPRISDGTPKIGHIIYIYIYIYSYIIYQPKAYQSYQSNIFQTPVFGVSD